MKALLLVLATFLSVSFVSEANAVVCAKGVYRAGCAGPNGVAVVTKSRSSPNSGCTAHPFRCSTARLSPSRRFAAPTFKLEQSRWVP